MIKTNFIRHGDDLDFASFKNMILHVIYYEKNNKGNNIENSNDVISFCNFLEVNLINANNFFEMFIFSPHNIIFTKCHVNPN